MTSTLATAVTSTRLFQNDSQPAIEIPEINWGALSPLIVMTIGAVVLLLAQSLIGRWLPQASYMLITVATGIGALVAAGVVWDDLDGRANARAFTTAADAYRADGFALLLMGLIACTVVLAALLAYDYLHREKLSEVEFYALLLLSASGGMVMAAANDLIVMFLGIEILSLAVYVMAAMHLGRVQSQEAGVKYFMLGAFASAFLLYGMALVYGATGSTNLTNIALFLSGDTADNDRLLFGGIALLLVGLGFKIAAVPFHAWTPDVYEGAPSPVVAYMASGVKVAGFAALLRLFYSTFGEYSDIWKPVVAVMAVATMVLGAFFALAQTSVKRMLAYSSISHAGYILLGVEAATDRGVEASLFYLVGYAFVVAGTFAVVTIVGRKGDNAHELSDYRGLAGRRPVLAFVFTVLLLAQAGIPLTTGFVGKLYVILASIESGSWVLALIAMISSVVAAFMYLRIVLTMYGDGAGASGLARIPIGARITMAVALAFTLFFGIFPGPIADLAAHALPQ